MNDETKKVTIYTDGACLGNPGPGGYGVVLLYGSFRKELSGGFRLTTNNRMEIMAAIVGLQALKQRCSVTVYTDSQYLVNSIMQGWAQRWQANGWKRNKKEAAINPDLWEQVLGLSSRHDTTFVWVKGHAGSEENERCDTLSVQAAQRKDLPTDVVYENERMVQATSPSQLTLKQGSESTNNMKITSEGQACRKCSTPVVKKIPRTKPQPGQAYRFEYYLYCPQCHTNYMVEEAKRSIE